MGREPSQPCAAPVRAVDHPAVWRRALACGLLLFVCVTGAGPAAAQGGYERPVETAPSQEDIGGGYVVPPVQRPRPLSDWREVQDVGLLAAALGLTAWLVLGRRSRRATVLLVLACVGYFGFYREGCVCPIGAIQNVTASLADPGYALPLVVVAIFFLPLIAALFFGRVFCGAACPLGAIQELVLLKPLRVPRRLDRGLGTLKWVYLALAVWFAAQPAAARDFVICRYDPFVSFFRWTGFAHLFVIGGALLLLGTLVGRPYCRWLCPYGALLSLVARLSWRGVSITPEKETDCGLCLDACPYGAIEKLRALRATCLACARCYRACPYQRGLEQEPSAAGGAPGERSPA